MTLLYIDGFAHQDSGRYSVSSPGFRTDGVSLGAPQAYCIYFANIARTVTASAQLFTGFRFRASSYTAGASIVSLWGDAGATQHLTVAMDASGHLTLYRGNTSGTLLATGTTVLGTSGFRYLEVRATIADSGGICQVRIDGVLEIDFTGDTKNAGTATNIDQVRFESNNSVMYYTDWYIANALGSAPQNTFLGDIVVRSLTPSGDGDLSGLTGSDGNSVANWQQVDEVPPSSSDYNGSPTSNAEDTYALTDLPTTNVTIYGAQVAALMAKSDAGAAAASAILRLSATDYSTGGSRALTTSYTGYLDLYQASPATSSAFTATEINGAQVGMKVT